VLDGCPARTPQGAALRGPAAVHGPPARRESRSARALEYTILTAARTGDTIGGVHGEINRKEGLWTIPAGRLKGRRGRRKSDHVIPLSDRALEIIDGRSEGAGFLFADEGGEPLSNMAMLELLQGMGFGKDLTVHGFRSTFNRKVLRSAGFRASMSRKGDCYDNARWKASSTPSKPNSSITVNMRHGQKLSGIFLPIEGFYNRTRRHSAIGYISPIEMELKQFNPVHFFGGRSG
jgi:hypothetical protein